MIWREPISSCTRFDPRRWPEDGVFVHMDRGNGSVGFHVKRRGLFALQRRGDLGFYQASDFEATNRIVHGFSTRLGGVSPTPFDSLNLGFGTKDTDRNVRKNREILTRAFGIPVSALFTARQRHGDDILVIDRSSAMDSPARTCDAMIAATPGIAIGVLTADCVPVLLFDPDRNVVAAIHAGWRGTAINLPGKTVRTMVDRFETRKGHLMAAIGPAIGPCCYEVDTRVRRAFSSCRDGWSEWARAVSAERWMLNLHQATLDLLVESGIRPDNITLLEICTHCESGLFYSHRRDTGTTGRQIAFIMLKP